MIKFTLLMSCLMIATARAGAADGKLDFFFIDTEGGASTLIVTPTDESILIDTGSAGGRDAPRIFAAAKTAGITQIDHLVITHYHSDHLGGAAELAKLLPIKNLYDNGNLNVSGELPTAAYLATPHENHTILHAGDLLPIKPTNSPELTIRCLAAHRQLIEAPAGAKDNPIGVDVPPKPLDKSDNADSIVLLLAFGDFRFFAGGDLTWNFEHDLVSPIDRVGTVDAYLVDHHGLAQSNNPALIRTLAPTVAIMSNGTKKGCEPEVFQTLKSIPTLQAIYQIHKNLRPDGDVNNTNDQMIANMNVDCAGNCIRMSATKDGKQFRVSLPASGFEKTYASRKHN